MNGGADIKGLTSDEVARISKELGEVVAEALGSNISKESASGPVAFDATDFAVALATGVSYAMLRVLGKHALDTSADAVHHMAESAIRDAESIRPKAVEVKAG